MTRVLRLAYAAARVVLWDGYRDVPHSLDRPGTPEEIVRWIDWEATAELRRRLGDLGLGIAEAMDTAQRFFLGWSNAERLIDLTAGLGLARGFCAGAGCDHLERVDGPEDLVRGVAHQAQVIRARGGVPVLLPMPQLSRSGADEETYVATYRGILERVEGPVYVHWLGAMFLPELEGYFPGRSFERVMELDPAKVRGAKLSLLDLELEQRLRSELLARDQLLLTGDDLHFGGLILGGDGEAIPAPQRWTEIDGQTVALGDFSHALLGILDGIAAPAAEALACLERGDAAGYRARMGPCEALSRHLFAPPTQHYKAGLAHLAHAAGWQSNDMLVNHEEQARDAAHYARARELARAAGLL